MNARRDPLGADEAMELLQRVNQLYVAKGKQALQFDLKQDRPDDAELRRLIVGPTGNLRAPAVRLGKKLIVGFNNDLYGQLFD